MSVEQWGILALVVLLPLLEAIARLRRARINNDRPSDRVAQAPPSTRRAIPLAARNVSNRVMGAETAAIRPPPSLPRLLPQPALDPAVPLAVRASQTPQSKASRSPEAHGRVQGPLPIDGVVQWLRPIRNLRRAIVAATILGPPTQ